MWKMNATTAAHLYRKPPEHYKSITILVTLYNKVNYLTLVNNISKHELRINNTAFI